MNSDIENLFKDKVLGHPAGLFVLFFTEMWERFSFYGMRVLLVLFLTAPILGDNPGWEWPRENALALIGTYASLLYLTPILGGYVADRFTGYRGAVVLGCLIMTLGHAAMALEMVWSFYLGLFFLIVGTGFFKPNITSVISEMYRGKESKKDGAYTIFYMGVNAGAFFGMMLCGYLAENWGWSWGFGLAGIFMMLGLLQFWLAGKLFGQIGAKPERTIPGVGEVIKADDKVTETESGKRNPFTGLDKALILLCSLGGLLYLINDPLSRIAQVNLLNFSLGTLSGNTLTILLALTLFLYLIVSRTLRYPRVVRDRIFAVSIFGIFTVFFFAAFEQNLGTLTLFARDYTNRTLVGTGALIFKVVDALLTTVPLMIITWVLYLLFKKTYDRIPLSNWALALAFVGVWALVLYRLAENFSEVGSEVEASWFPILNSFYIITLAPLFSRWWESRFNPSGANKYGIGLLLTGLGFGVLVIGTLGIPLGAKTASVSMVFLILAYLFITMGELCLSPLGLSYLSKLVPSRMIGIMFGLWYLAIAIGQKAAGSLGGMIDRITEQYSLSAFFGIFMAFCMGIGLLAILLNPLLRRLMHGVR